MSVENAYRILFLGALIWFGLLLLITLIRAIIGPRVTDRILSINMICTMVIACTCILAYFLNESYLFDVALLYALISFITVLILSATYIPKNPTRSKFASDRGSAAAVAAEGAAEAAKGEKGAEK
jgi:multicomponent Na+:H+ antiporter subunit F